MTVSEATIDIEGFSLPCVTFEESLKLVLDAPTGRLTKVGWINAHCANLRRQSPSYQEALDSFQHVFNDGIGVELAARMQGLTFPGNLNGTDWIPAFLSRLADEPSDSSRRVFLLGSTPEGIASCRKEVEQRWPSLPLVGAQDGYFRSEDEVVQNILDAKTQILILGMGVPKQEEFLFDHASVLEAGGVQVAIAGGAILDFLGQTVRRAPKFVRAIHAEWAWRLGLEPVRLARRYLIGNPVFLFHAFRHSRRA